VLPRAQEPKRETAFDTRRGPAQSVITSPSRRTPPSSSPLQGGEERWFRTAGSHRSERPTGRRVGWGWCVPLRGRVSRRETAFNKGVYASREISPKAAAFGHTAATRSPDLPRAPDAVKADSAGEGVATATRQLEVNTSSPQRRGITQKQTERVAPPQHDCGRLSLHCAAQRAALSRCRNLAPRQHLRARVRSRAPQPVFAARSYSPAPRHTCAAR